MLAVHDDHTRHQRFFSHAPGDVGEVDSLLHIGGEQHEKTRVRAQVDGLVAAAERGAMSRRGTRTYVENQRRVLAGCRDQQILCRRDIRAGQESRRASACQCEAGHRGNNTAGSFSGLRRQRFTKKIAAAVCEFTEPYRVGVFGRHRTTEYRVAGDAGFGYRYSAVAIEHGFQAFFPDIRTCRRAEHLAIPANCDITHVWIPAPEIVPAQAKQSSEWHSETLRQAWVLHRWNNR